MRCVSKRDSPNRAGFLPFFLSSRPQKGVPLNPRHFLSFFLSSRPQEVALEISAKGSPGRISFRLPAQYKQNPELSGQGGSSSGPIPGGNSNSRMSLGCRGGVGVFGGTPPKWQAGFSLLASLQKQAKRGPAKELESKYGFVFFWTFKMANRLFLLVSLFKTKQKGLSYKRQTHMGVGVSFGVSTLCAVCFGEHKGSYPFWRFGLLNALACGCFFSDTGSMLHVSGTPQGRSWQ